MSTCKSRGSKQVKKSGGCPPSRQEFNSLAEIVSDYIESKRPEAELELSFYRTLPNLEEAIRVSALAKVLKDGEEEKHDHQWRIPPKLLEELRKGLIKKQDAIRSCKDFDSLLAITEQVAGKIWKNAELTIYDTAHRLATYRGIEPEFIYLHAGTREGARELGFPGNKKFLRHEDLPKQLRTLKPYELENLFCTRRSTFRRLRLAGALNSLTR